METINPTDPTLTVENQGQPTPKQPRRHPSAGEMFAFIGVFIIAQFIGGILKIILDKTLSTSAEFSTFIAYITAMGLTIFYVIWQGWQHKEKMPTITLSVKGFNPTLVLCGVVLVMITSVVIEPLINLFPSKYLEFLNSAVGTGSWAMLTTIVTAPILEELLFRGLIQGRIQKGYGAVRAVVFSAAIFGIIHFIPQQVVNAFFIGLILGYIYLKTHSLLAVITIHAINNAIAFISMTIFTPEQTSTRNLIGNDTLYYIFYGGCCVIFIIAMVAVFRQIQKIGSQKDNNSTANDVDNR